MSVENEIGAGIEFPRKAVRFDPRGAARFPEKEVAVEIENAVLNAEIHAGKARSGLDFLEARGARAIHQQVCVMHAVRNAGANFDRAHVTLRSERRRENKIPENIGTGSRNGISARRVEDHIWRAELPAFGEMRRRRRFRR